MASSKDKLEDFLGWLEISTTKIKFPKIHYNLFKPGQKNYLTDIKRKKKEQFFR